MKNFERVNVHRAGHDCSGHRRALFRRTGKYGQEIGESKAGQAHTLTFLTRQVRQPVLLRVYFGRLRWEVSAGALGLGEGAWRLGKGAARWVGWL